MKNILKREYNKGKPVTQIIFHIFYSFNFNFATVFPRQFS